VVDLWSHESEPLTPEPVPGVPKSPEPDPPSGEPEPPPSLEPSTGRGPVGTATGCVTPSPEPSPDEPEPFAEDAPEPSLEPPPDDPEPLCVEPSWLEPSVPE
jgi:hypothetical protein